MKKEGFLLRAGQGGYVKLLHFVEMHLSSDTKERCQPFRAAHAIQLAAATAWDAFVPSTFFFFLVLWRRPFGVLAGVDVGIETRKAFGS